MKSNIQKGLCFLLVFFALLPSFAVSAEDQKSFRQDILHFEMQRAGVQTLQDFVDSSMTENPASGAEWYLLALKKSNPELALSRYGEALSSYVEKNTIASASTRKKLAFVLMASGKEKHPFVNEVRNEEIAGQGIMSYVFALHLLNQGVSLREYEADAVIAMLLDLVLEDGGWALNGKHSDVDVTAMVLQALASHREKDGVQAVIDKALIKLSSMQKADGDFESYGVTNPESTSQVIMALTALGIDPLGDTRFLQADKTLLDGLLKYRLDDGSFCHSVGGTFNQNATVQAFCALSALEAGSLYDIGDFSSLPLLVELPDNDLTDLQEEGTSTWKWYVIGGILFVALLLFVLFSVKRKLSSAVWILVTAVLLSGLFGVMDIQTPDDYYRYEEPEDPIGTVTFSVRCDAVAGRDGFPNDGMMVAEDTYKIGEGDSVYDLLLRVSKANKIPLATSGGYSTYVMGINALFEFDYGETSGWVYTVNGKSPSLACDQYRLQDGDSVVFFYTLTLGTIDET